MTKNDINTAIATKDKNTIKPKVSKEINVVVHIPESIHERTRQQKINRIYDILTPEKY